MSDILDDSYITLIKERFVNNLTQDNRMTLDYFEADYGTFITSYKEFIDTYVVLQSKYIEPRKVDRILSEVTDYAGKR